MQLDELEGLLPRALEHDLEAESMRRRIAAQLFGAPSMAVTIGRFVVLETLGRGNMGVVYAAQDGQLQRQVALKLIRGDIVGDDPRERERLIREARALARLSHPNVVQVHEVGEHGDDVFLVMELVRGVTLREWLDQRERSLAEILDRFMQAAHGLDAAHRVGIVHGDFKPSNALVGEDGRVRLVDFGLALAPPLDEPTTESSSPGTLATSASRSVRPAGTPAYMAPEHLRGRNGPRSDQFSFCVALFEALHGRRPYTPEQLLELSRRPEAGPTPIPARSLPRALRRILVRGLSPRADDRFRSMSAVTDGLVRIQSQSRRRRLALASILTLTLGVGVGLQVREHAPRRCVDSGAPLQGVWDEARRAAAGLAFAGSGLAFAEQAWTRTGQALDAYVARWIATRRDLCAATWIRGERSEAALGRSERCLDAARRALGHLADALVTADAALIGEAEGLVAELPDPDTCRGLVERERPDAPDPGLASMLGRARIFERTQQAREARDLLALALERSRLLGDRGVEAEVLYLLGRVRARLLREPLGAWTTLHEALDRAILADRTELVGPIWIELALVAGYELERRDEAWSSLGHARSALGDALEPGDRAALLAVEGQLLEVDGKYEEALSRRREVITIVEQLHPVGHPERFAARQALANGLAAAGVADAVAEREPLCSELMDLHGAAHPWVARCEFDLGLDLLDLGHPVEARHRIESALAVLATTYGSANPRVASAHLALARLDAGEGASEQALGHAEAALAIFDAEVPPGHNDRIAALMELASLYAATDRLDDALRINRELLRIHDEEETGARVDLQGVLINVGECLCDLGRCSEALPVFTRLMALHGASEPDEPELQAFPFRGIGRVHLARGEPALALPLLERALAILESTSGDGERRLGVDAVRTATATDLEVAKAALRQVPPRSSR